MWTLHGSWMGENLATCKQAWSSYCAAVRCSRSVPDGKMKLSSRREYNFISCSITLEAIGQLVQGKLCRNMSRKGKTE